jgi:hypothetical protein
VIEIEQTAMWADVKKIFEEGEKPVKFEWTATLHTVDDDVEIVKVITVDSVRDYANKIAHRTHIEMIMPLGDYVKRLYPYRNNMELTLRRIRQTESGDAIYPGARPEEDRYKAIFLMKYNKNIRGGEYDSFDKESLDNMDIVTVKLQLIQLPFEPIRIKTMGGSFQGVTPENFIRAALAGESLKVIADGKPVLDGINIVPPDNTKARDHYVIPHNTPIHAIPTLIHEKMGGVYSAGIGTYFQTYRGKRMWFVYPLYNTTRFKEDVPKVVFYSVPQQRFMGVERTYRVESDMLYVACTSKKNYSDSGETDLMDSGSGFRMADSRAFMKKPVEITEDGPVGARKRLNFEVAIKDRADGLNYAPQADSQISSNPYAQTSRVIARAGARIDLTWENSVPQLLYPGMPAKFVYLLKDQVKEVEGVVLFAHTVTQLAGQGISVHSYKTSTQIVLFVSDIYEES